MFKKLLFYVVVGFVAFKVCTSAGVADFVNNNEALRNLFKIKDEDGIAAVSLDIQPKTALHCHSLFKQGAHDRAASCYKQALISDRNNPEIYYYLAYSYYKNRNHQSAMYYADYVMKYWKDTKFAYSANKIYNGAKADLAEKEKLETSDKPDYYDEIKNPAHWGKMPVTVWIEPGHNTANLFNAFSNWQNALYPTVSFKMVTRQEEANIAVIFDDPKKYCNDKRVIGCAKWWVYADDRTKFYNAKIYLTHYDSRGTQLSDTYLYSVLCHEIGHALGITSGHSKNKSDVMYRDEGKYNTRPTSRDIRTIMRIYGK